MDAEVAYKFHSERQNHPEKFKNQFTNQVGSQCFVPSLFSEEYRQQPYMHSIWLFEILRFYSSRFVILWIRHSAELVTYLKLRSFCLFQCSLNTQSLHVHKVGSVHPASILPPGT